MDTSVFFARWQQRVRALAGVGVVFYYPLGSVQTPYRYH